MSRLADMFKLSNLVIWTRSVKKSNPRVSVRFNIFWFD